MILYSLLASLGFALLYGQTALAHTGSTGAGVVIGALAFVALAISFLAPPRWFRYTHADAAPRVMSQVISRAIVAAILVLALSIAAWLLVAPSSIAWVEELYTYALLAIFLFHGFGGAIASHVIYLQATHQYNSNQLVAVLVTVTLLIFVLILYFLALDWAIPRDESIHLRDLIVLTLVLLGYGRAIYLMAHH